MCAASPDLFGQPSVAVSPRVVDSVADSVPTTAKTITVPTAKIETLSQTPSKNTLPPKSLEDILVYDPDEIAAYYRSRPLQILLRLIKIFWIASGYVFGLLWDKITGRQKVNEQKRAEGLRVMLTRLGPAYIKVGQALSTDRKSVV